MKKDYKPFGPEWEKEMMKFPKKYLIDLYRQSYKNKQEISDTLSALLKIYTDKTYGDLVWRLMVEEKANSIVRQGNAKMTLQ